MLTNPIRESTSYSFYTSSKLVAGVFSFQELQGKLVTGLLEGQTFVEGVTLKGLFCYQHVECNQDIQKVTVTVASPFTCVAEYASNCCSCESPEAMQESSRQVKRRVWDRLRGCVPQQEQKSRMNSRFVSGHNSTGVEEESNVNRPKVLGLSYYELELHSQTAPHCLAAQSELVTGLSHNKLLAG